MLPAAHGFTSRLINVMVVLLPLNHSLGVNLFIIDVPVALQIYVSISDVHSQWELTLNGITS